MKSKSIVIRSHGGPEVIEMVEADVPDPGRARYGSGSARSGLTSSTSTIEPACMRTRCRMVWDSKARE